jgi:hypothetical protein
MIFDFGLFCFRAIVSTMEQHLNSKLRHLYRGTYLGIAESKVVNLKSQTASLLA